MISLFKIAAQDQSVYYLGQIFGLVGSVLPVKDPPLLMGILFKTLNTMALTIGAFLVVYVTVVGLLKTAQEGEFLGRQWNSLWVPVRTVMGIAALFPTSTGYSAIQVIIMWIILQGVGAADVMWSKVLEYTVVMGSPYAGASDSQMSLIQVETSMKILFQGLVCQASAKAAYPDITITSTAIPKKPTEIKYYCGQSDTTDAFCTDSNILNPIKDDSTVYSMGPNGACGSLEYCSLDACKAPDKAPHVPEDDPALIAAAAKSAACLTCKAQRSAIQAIVPALGAVASKVVTIDYLYALFYETPLSKAGSPPDWIKNYCTARGIPTAQCCRASGMLGLTCIFKAFPLDYVESTTDYRNTSSSASAPSDTPDSATNFYLQYPMGAYLDGSNFINAAVGEYEAAIVGAFSTAVQNQMDSASLTGWQSDAEKYGWILAGAYYYKMAAANQRNQDALYPKFQVQPPPDNSPVLKDYRNNYKAIGDLLSAMSAATADANTGSPGYGKNNVPGMPPGISGALDGASRTLLANWITNMTSNTCIGAKCFVGKPTNPLISIATFGYQMMIIAQLLFTVIVILVAVFTLAMTLTPIVLGTGLTMNPLGESLKAVVGVLGPFFFILISALYSIGALLGIYVPLIPYMIFTLGAIGWLIATVEAMVAGPIIALGILSPGGQHDILGRAEQSMFQLLNLFLRPVLMVVGMMASMFMCIAVVNLVNMGFSAATKSIMSNPGLFEAILFIAAYTSFIVTVVNKAFSLIYVIPERVTTWIGGHAVQYGEEQGLGATKQSVESGASAATGSAKESGGAAQTGATAVKGAMETEKADAKAGKGGAQITPAKGPDKKDTP